MTGSLLLMIIMELLIEVLEVTTGRLESVVALINIAELALIRGAL
jgi:hypothetical protein